jgi:acetyl-CoA C-acetyltransferase
MPEAYIIDAVRTPRSIGKVGKGALSHMHPQHLGAAVLAALRDRNNLETAHVDDVIWGTSVQVGYQAGDLGRMAALDAGYDIRSSGVTLDRFCGSGLTAASLATAQVMSGMEDVVIAGGTEMMSYVNQTMQEQIAAGIKLPNLTGSGNLRLRKQHPQSHQGVSADAIAAAEGIGREELDAFALESQRRAGVAIAEGRFSRSLIPVLDDNGAVVLDHEEFPRPDTTIEDLARLKPSFEKLADYPADDTGVTFRQLILQRYPDLDIVPVHHAGNSSGVVDGAAALLITSDAYASRAGLKPRARIVATANMGDDPTFMLNAPGPAARKVLAKAGLTVDDIDVWEINEAFAVVPEKVIRDLGLDRAKVNINGGAIALGHPIGATGAVLIGAALDELERANGRYGLITMCTGGGMAPAIVIERI